MDSVSIIRSPLSGNLLLLKDTHHVVNRTPTEALLLPGGGGASSNF